MLAGKEGAPTGGRLGAVCIPKGVEEPRGAVPPLPLSDEEERAVGEEGGGGRQPSIAILFV